MPRNELCVYEAGTVNEADIVVAWLAQHDIEAIVPDRHTTSTLGLPDIIPGGAEVCVTDAAKFAEAQALIAEHEQALTDHLAATAPSGTIVFSCGNCGKTVNADATDAGRVINCPHCHEYVDVPDPTEAAE
jgi:hypothetical protein